MNQTFAVIGGDARHAKLAQLLSADGHPVTTFDLAESFPVSGSLGDALAADCVVLPLPLSRIKGLLNSKETLELETLWQGLAPKQLICAGQVSGEDMARAAGYGLHLTDYFKREELTVANAVPTAEGALQIAMEQLPITLCGARCLILGCGRIAKLLAHRLQHLGARVTVAARKYGDLAWADAFGWEPLHISRLHGRLSNVHLVFNTIPSLILDGDLLAELPPDCLCIDLASQPGMDFDAAKALGLSAVWARFLPGKVAPVTAAAAIRDALYHIWEERGDPV